MQTIEELEGEVKRIRGRYKDSRKGSWYKEDRKSMCEEELKTEKAIEGIVGILMDGKYTISACKEIFLQAWERVSLTTPVGISTRYPGDLQCQESALEGSGGNSQTHIPQKNL
ncbi:hypothetical protein [Parabacteroides goldsteinii]|uniref:hypothetical protein n=1 Tax=Parabacteroides goldsteinii TaxID=328812 RepID=UPI002578A469|nr:hypothetical protein [Parabacteroides goldsteinii]